MLLLVMALVPSAAPARAGWKAGDRDVYGRVQGLRFEGLDEFCMSSSITARLTITRVVRGRPPARELFIKYIAHGDYRADMEFRFHLRPSGAEGAWLACQNGRGQGFICRSKKLDPGLRRGDEV